jgi:hypothetical protein
LAEREFKSMRSALKDSGLIEAYNRFLGNLRVKGIPTLIAGEFGDDGGASGDVFEYAGWYLKAIYEET